MIFILTVILLVSTVINYYLSARKIFNPAVVVSAVFFLSSLLGCIANIAVGIDVNNIYTVIIVVIGTSIFTLMNYIFGTLNIVVEKDKDIKNIKNVYKFLAVILLMATIVVNYNYIMMFGATYGAGADFFDAAVKYKIIMTFSDLSAMLVTPPWYRTLLIYLANAIVIIFSFMYIKNTTLKNENSCFELLVIILFFIETLMDGSRSATFRLVTMLLFLWIYFKRRNIDFSPLKAVFKIILIMVAMSLFFIFYLVAVGRDDGSFDAELVLMQLFIYISAPIFNLDIYLGNPWHATYGLLGEMTFVRLINSLGDKYGITNWIYALDLPYMSYQNYDLGNVYTTFYAFYYDFGFFGVIFLTAFMAFVSMWIYRKCFTDITSINGMFFVMCYSYLLNDLIMLPFSNRFYENVFNTSFFYIMFFLYISLLMCVRFQKADKEKKP